MRGDDDVDREKGVSGAEVANAGLESCDQAAGLRAQSVSPSNRWTSSARVVRLASTMPQTTSSAIEA